MVGLSFVELINNDVNWIVSIIKWIITNCKYVALGVIVFTVILKLITLPFDFISKAQMRKNSLIMEEMRPDLEKLQKQYANDKALYSQKMMALYKKNGYSMFGACLPTIITLVIFIIALNGFTGYSQFKNKDYFNQMIVSYNKVISYGLETDGNYITLDENSGKLIIKMDELKDKADSSFPSGNVNINVKKIDTDRAKYYEVYTDNSYVKYIQYYNADGSFSDSLCTPYLEKLKENTTLYLPINGENKTFSQFLSYYNEEHNKGTEGFDLNDETDIAKLFINGICAERSADTFRANKGDMQFLWVKNIWVTDSPLSHPVSSSTAVLNTTQGCSCKPKESVSQETYDILVYKLDAEKKEPNGYFILVVLTAVTSFLTQFVMNKSQKASMELQTVDGQGANTQKIMMWVMPIMMAVFSFSFTSAFSIYMILSSVLSIAFTFMTNAIIDRKFKKKKIKENAGVIRGRVHDEEEPPKPVKNNKKVDDGPNFIKGLGDKHYRGRLK